MQVRRTREQWRQIVADYSASGLRAVDFAEQKGLNINTFSWWRHELRQESQREAKLSFVSVPAPPTEPVVVQFTDGTQLLVPRGIEPSWVSDLAKALR